MVGRAIGALSGHQLAAEGGNLWRGVSQADILKMMAYGRLCRYGRLTFLYPHHRQVGCDEGPIDDFDISSSDDRLELFAIDVACGEDMAMRLARVCEPVDTSVPA